MVVVVGNCMSGLTSVRGGVVEISAKHAILLTPVSPSLALANLIALESAMAWLRKTIAGDCRPQSGVGLNQRGAAAQSNTSCYHEGRG